MFVRRVQIAGQNHNITTANSFFRLLPSSSISERHVKNQHCAPEALNNRIDMWTPQETMAMRQCRNRSNDL